MNDRDRENLAELIERFFHDEQAGSVLEDIREGEQILRDNPAPEPDHKLIADIKAEIALLLPTRRARLARRQMYRRVAVAAAFVIIAAISATLLNDGSPETRGPQQFAGLIPTRIWDSDNIAADDENLAVFAAEIDQIENEVMSLEAGDDTYRSYGAVEELEIELMVVSNDFWKE
ncbi:MAG: hypothetical protein JSW47_08380 [Phycisphaerales bacterium]|nr:MAG: hypothetical protein JSW47_08380 [Phycisphaerales bacterium]